MKKAATAVALFMMLSMVSCGINMPSSPQSSVSKTAEATVTTATKTAVVKEEKPQKKVITFKEQVVIDTELCYVKITGIDPDNIWGYKLNVQLENRSSDKTFMYSIRNASVNGVECSPAFSAKVAAGKKANDEITFMSSDLKENGITEYSDIELAFHIYDADNWTDNDIADVTIHIYPYGEENATKYIRSPQPSDTVIFDSDAATVTVIGYKPDSLLGYEVLLFLENKSDVELMFSADDTSINGYMVNSLFAKSVEAGKCTFTSISWFNSSLKENGITNVDEIEMKFRIYNYEDWLTDDVFNGTVVLKP